MRSSARLVVVLGLAAVVGAASCSLDQSGIGATAEQGTGGTPSGAGGGAPGFDPSGGSVGQAGGSPGEAGRPGAAGAPSGGAPTGGAPVAGGHAGGMGGAGSGAAGRGGNGNAGAPGTGGTPVAGAAGQPPAGGSAGQPSTAGAGGNAGAGGAGGATAGSSGTAGNPGTGGSGGSNVATCCALAQEWIGELPAARSCSRDNASACEIRVPVSLNCSCTTFVDDTTALKPIYDRWKAAGCTTGSCPTSPCLDVVCRMPDHADCKAAGMRGVCTDRF